MPYDRLKRSAKAYDGALASHAAGLITAEALARLLGIDAGHRPELWPPITGLPGRPWYKNLIYAPGRLTGYGAKTLPGVREAIEDQRWSDATQYIGLTAGTLNAYSARLDEATTILKR